jgi:hypothetical protein
LARRLNAACSSTRSDQGFGTIHARSFNRVAQAALSHQALDILDWMGTSWTSIPMVWPRLVALPPGDATPEPAG